MTRSIERLPARAVETITKPGRHSDGGNLYLSISPDGTRKRWVFLYTLAGKQREMGLGAAGAKAVSLKEVRVKARSLRELVAEGIDPLAEREKPAALSIPTFAEAAANYIQAHEAGWVPKHTEQFVNSLRDYCGPIANKPIDQIDTEAVLLVLRPIWARIPETASRVRGRIENILDAARALGHIDPQRANPARLKGHIAHLLPRRSKLSRSHHRALPYEDVPAFVAQLRTHDGVTARSLEFVILTGVRTGEALGARVEEFDLNARVWTVPATRTKTRTQYRVPLGDRAIEIVAASPRGSYVFGGQTKGTPLSNTALRALIYRLGIPVTVHGFRSAFRDWAGNETDTPREIAEQALGHLVGNEVERAYRRGDALERRRALMLAWEKFVTGAGGGSNVVELRRAAE